MRLNRISGWTIDVLLDHPVCRCDVFGVSVLNNVGYGGTWKEQIINKYFQILCSSASVNVSSQCEHLYAWERRNSLLELIILVVMLLMPILLLLPTLISSLTDQIVPSLTQYCLTYIRCSPGFQALLSQQYVSFRTMHAISTVSYSTENYPCTNVLK